MPFASRTNGTPSSTSLRPMKTGGGPSRSSREPSPPADRGLPSLSGASLPPSPSKVGRPVASSSATSLLFDPTQQVPTLPPPSSCASSVRAAASRRPSATGSPLVCDPTAQSSTRRPSAVGAGLLSPLGHANDGRPPSSPSRSVSSPLQTAGGGGGGGLAIALGNALKPKAKWARGLTRRGSSSAMSVLGDGGRGDSPTTLIGASASTPSLLLTGGGRVDGGGGVSTNARHPTLISSLRPTTTHGGPSHVRSSTTTTTPVHASTSLRQPAPRSAPPGTTTHPSSSPSTLAVRSSPASAANTREPPLERKPSRLFFSLRKSSAARRPSAASLFGGSQAGPTGAAGREIDVGAPFNCQHDLHVGMDDLTALPAEWIAQLKAQGLSSEQLLKLARDKSRSVAEREKVAPRPIGQLAADSPQQVALANIGPSEASRETLNASSSPSSTPSDDSIRTETPPSSPAASEPALIVRPDVECLSVTTERVSPIPDRTPALSLPMPLLPLSSTTSEPADTWAQGLLGAFSSTSPLSDGSLGKAGARRSLPPTRRVSSSAPPLGSDGNGNVAHGHSQSLSFLSACKTYDAERGSAGSGSLAPPLLWKPLSKDSASLGLGAPPAKPSLDHGERSASRASSTRPRESSSDHGHGGVDGGAINGQRGVGSDDDDRPPRRRQRQARESSDSFATAASEPDGSLPPNSYSMDGLEEFGVSPVESAPVPSGTFGQVARPAWLDGRRTSNANDGSEESGPLPDLLSSISSSGHHRSNPAARAAADSRLSVASRFTATSRVTSLSPSTFSSSDFHSHEGQLVEDAVISRAVHLSSRPVGDWAHHDGKAMRLTVFEPAFLWPAEAPTNDGRSPVSLTARTDDQPPVDASSGVRFSSDSHASSSLVDGAEDDDDDAREGVDALDQAVQIFRAKSLDNLRALIRSESSRSGALVDPA